MSTAQVVLSSAVLSIDEIMDRLSRLCRMGTSLRCRSRFPSGSAKWYVSMMGVRVPGTCDCYSGSTPEEAIRKTWDTVSNQKFTYIRYFCKPDESVPGDGPQVWVRWSQEKDDWEDVPPADDWWADMASEIRPYADHKWREQQN